MPFGAIYTGTSGMQAFARALDNISNNVANLNTPGFKLSALSFQDVFYAQSFAGGNGEAYEHGNGVKATSTLLQFSQGELRETGNSTDLAIEGNGFFVLRDGSEQVYTRAGQFVFGEDGYLVTEDGQARVAAIDENGGLHDLQLGDLDVSRPEPTATVKLVGNLSPGSTEHQIEGVLVTDSTGAEHELTLVLTRVLTADRTWSVEVRDGEGATIATPGEVRFGGDGSPLEGFADVRFEFAPASAEASEVTLDFGTPGRFDGATSFSAGSTSTLGFASSDGHGAGSALGFSFDEDGFLQVTYSNGETRTGPRVALAWFDDLQALEQLGGGRFRAPESIQARLAAANEDVMGLVRGGTIEISNVDLTEQFTNLIIVQRGFQASSQVLTAANEMMQEILESLRPAR